MERVAISSSSGSSGPRNQTQVSGINCVVGSFLLTAPLGKPSIKWQDDLIFFCSYHSFHSFTYKVASQFYLPSFLISRHFAFFFSVLSPHFEVSVL